MMTNLNIDVPECDLIIASDAVVGNIVYLRYSSMDVLNRALHRLKHLGRKHLLTGHMGVRSVDAIANALFYMGRLREIVIAARQSSDATDSVLKTELQACLPLGSVKSVLFVPYALYDRDAYALQARKRFEKMGFDLTSIHTASDPAQVINDTEAVFIGGGNTFRLLKALYDFDLIERLRRRVAEGMPYVGSSAGSNVAGPTIKTTKDMPIVQPPSFDALGLVPFQISPHFLDPDPNSTHMGETQEERILQFLEENDTTVAGLREGAMVRVENGLTTLKGSAGARIFRKGMEPVEVQPGAQFNDLLVRT
jgi:dipeptidase E